MHDGELGVEYCLFDGVAQKFPRHVHEAYVVGLVERGTRSLICVDEEHEIGPGTLMFLNPLDPHECTQIEGLLRYRSLHLPESLMAEVFSELVGFGRLRFTKHVVRDDVLEADFDALCRSVETRAQLSERQEALYCLAADIVERQAGEDAMRAVRDEGPGSGVERVRAYIEVHAADKLELEELASLASVSVWQLIRLFTRAYGITPYRYLQSIRIDRVKGLLAGGLAPAGAALEAGFSDQAHLTRTFKSFVGVTPGQYAAMFRERR